jgi:hypothetical protein
MLRGRGRAANLAPRVTVAVHAVHAVVLVRERSPCLIGAVRDERSTPYPNFLATASAIWSGASSWM